VVGLLPMGSSRALSRACISQRGRYMLPRGPANAAANAHRGPLVVPPRGRSHHGRAPKVPGAGGTASVGCRVAAGAVLSTGWPVVFDLGADGQSGAGPVPSLRAFSRQCRGLPIAAARDPRGSRDDGEALWGVLCLSCGTSPERIAPESLTRSMSDFVHGHISWGADLLPPNRVTGLTRLPPRGAPTR
jgi:hypothetical protein